MPHGEVGRSRRFAQDGTVPPIHIVLAGSVASAAHRLPVLPFESEVLGEKTPYRHPSQTVSLRMGTFTVPTPVHRAARVFRGHPAIGFVVAIASIGVATAIQFVARDLYRETPFLTIYPAVVITAFFGGYRAGMFSAFLGGVSQWYLFIPVLNWLGVATYAVDATVCVLLIEYINRNLEKETEAKERQILLKQELHHRIGNFFAVIQAVIQLSLPKDNAPVSAAVIKDGLLDRLQGMFDANQQIIEFNDEVPLLDLIERQIRGLHITIDGRPHFLLDPQMTQNVSLVLHELVTNSLKHGALSSSEGRIHLSLTEMPTSVVFDWAELNGPIGSAPPADKSEHGFGFSILGSFARSFCSDVNISYEPQGFHYRLEIPR